MGASLAGALVRVRKLTWFAVVCLTVPIVFLCRCKLFYKKDSEFKEKGVGTLHLKPTANQKTQLLVRADTNLGGYLFLRAAQSRPGHVTYRAPQPFPLAESSLRDFRCTDAVWEEGPLGHTHPVRFRADKCCSDGVWARGLPAAVAAKGRPALPVPLC